MLITVEVNLTAPYPSAKLNSFFSYTYIGMFIKHKPKSVSLLQQLEVPRYLSKRDQSPLGKQIFY